MLVLPQSLGCGLPNPIRPMRLTPGQIQTILATTQDLTGNAAEVYLFGSRTDDQTRGGDVDLLIETRDGLTLLERAHLKVALETRLGLPIDIVSQARTQAPTPFQRIARARAIRLETRP